MMQAMKEKRRALVEQHRRDLAQVDREIRKAERTLAALAIRRATKKRRTAR